MMAYPASTAPAEPACEHDDAPETPPTTAASDRPPVSDDVSPPEVRATFSAPEQQQLLQQHDDDDAGLSHPQSLPPPAAGGGATDDPAADSTHCSLTAGQEKAARDWSNKTKRWYPPPNPLADPNRAHSSVVVAAKALNLDLNALREREAQRRAPDFYERDLQLRQNGPVQGKHGSASGVTPDTVGSLRSFHGRWGPWRNEVSENLCFDDAILRALETNHATIELVSCDLPEDASKAPATGAAPFMTIWAANCLGAHPSVVSRVDRDKSKSRGRSDLADEKSKSTHAIKHLTSMKRASSNARKAERDWNQRAEASVRGLLDSAVAERQLQLLHAARQRQEENDATRDVTRDVTARAAQAESERATTIVQAAALSARQVARDSSSQSAKVAVVCGVLRRWRLTRQGIPLESALASESGAINSNDWPTNSKESAYDVLGITERWCGQDDVRSAYQKALFLAHPDKNPDIRNGDRLQLVQQAYGLLRDVKKRARYDAIMDKELATVAVERAVK
mmetsp:Transcript_10092/g.25648  ORF Transcript_10092/g.25648 Transcript_10092/m.25648 type:complete len:510 (+) Transcript_10092:486-2015(+)